MIPMKVDMRWRTLPGQEPENWHKGQCIRTKEGMIGWRGTFWVSHETEAKSVWTRFDWYLVDEALVDEAAWEDYSRVEEQADDRRGNRTTSPRVPSSRMLWISTITCCLVVLWQRAYLQIWFGLIHFTSLSAQMPNNGHIEGRSQIQESTDEGTRFTAPGLFWRSG